MPSESTFELRDRDLGVMVMQVTPHEAQILAEHGDIEGVAVFRTRRVKYLKLTVAARAALARLRRKLYCTGRTVAEASQLISRQNIPGGGVVYSHITKRTNTYAPSERQGSHPVFATLRRA
jgi:hypothetical protein